jgi:hypothetical protein
MDFKSYVARGVAALGLVTGVVAAGALPAFAGTGEAGHGHTLFVSNATSHEKSMTTYGDGGYRWGCKNAPYSTITAGVASASAGDTVVVCPGTYTEDVVITKAITLKGDHATIDATGLNNGVQVVTSGVTVKGFKITKAVGEGILVGVDSLSDPQVPFLISQGLVLSHVAVLNNYVLDDNTGFSGPGGSTSTCVYGGDCGGGIHFNVTSHSIMSGNKVVGNADGVLLTDDYGPNFGNLIIHNYVADNATECGITLPSHSTDAVTFDPTTMQVTGRNPTKGGVYDNKVLDNVAIDNGTVVVQEHPGVFTGSGAGVGIFGSGPGSAAYDNLIKGNYIAGNGLAGVTIHAHAPGGEDVNGNTIVSNVIGTNNIGGDPEDGPGFPQDPSTTGISIFSAVALAHMTVAHNRIFNNNVGIWYTAATVTLFGLPTNSFHNVTTPIQGA